MSPTPSDILDSSSRYLPFTAPADTTKEERDPSRGRRPYGRGARTPRGHSTIPRQVVFEEEEEPPRSRLTELLRIDKLWSWMREPQATQDDTPGRRSGSTPPVKSEQYRKQTVKTLDVVVPASTIPRSRSVGGETLSRRAGF
jgi:hypothetical protein